MVALHPLDTQIIEIPFSKPERTGKLDRLVETDRGNFMVLDADESPEFETDSLVERNYGIAVLARDVVDPAYTVIVPQKVISHELLAEALETHDLNEDETWIYGSLLPQALLKRSLKIQVHLPPPGERAPVWFDCAFARKLQAITLPGFSCFTVGGLLEAALTLLDEFETIRLKDPTAASGEEQTIVASRQELDQFLLEKQRAFARRGGFAQHLAEYGYVVEANLIDVESWSFTLSTMPDQGFTSIGRLVDATVPQPDGSTMTEYGGTSVMTVRGDSEQLLDPGLPEVIPVDDPLRNGNETLHLHADEEIIRTAEIYIDALRGWEADDIVRTRANVDVLRGTLVHRNGEREEIVAAVEDSGRSGGASAAELMAARKLNESEEIDYAVYSTRHVFDPEQCKIYRRHLENIEDSVIFWDGVDASWGDKYVMFCSY
jgi:hypothetical protein